MKQNRLILLSISFIALLLISSCSETAKVELPTSALIHYSVADKQVAFAALAHNADTYLWDFGDGETSPEPNPVHVYENGGYYTVTLTVTGGTGTVVVSDDLALALTPYVLLTGGPTAENGKTWRLSGSHSEFDYFAYSDPNLTPYEGTPNPLPAGILGAGLGMGEVYNDEFTFYFDGSYKIDVKDDDAAFAGALYQLATGGTMVNTNGIDLGLVTAIYTPANNDTFTFAESEDLQVPSALGAGGVATFQGVTTIDFSSNAYLGFYDLYRKVIVQELTNSSMRVVMFASLDPDALGAGLTTNALILTFEAVN